MSSSAAMSRSVVDSLPYVQLLAMLGESNLPPGGFRTTHTLITACTLGPHSKVLHAGCNAGFLSREIARISGCQVTGIDISPEMADAANSRARSEGLADRVGHECRDMRTTGFPTATFDVTLSGGALAFVVDQPSAISEWIRVTRPYGIIADAELYYRETPPQALRERVAKVIGVEVPLYDADYWPRLFRRAELIPYTFSDSAHATHSEDRVREYCERMIAWCAKDADEQARAALRRRLLECYLLFNENLWYTNYQVFSFRRMPDDSEPLLFV